MKASGCTDFADYLLKLYSDQGKSLEWLRSKASTSQVKCPTWLLQLCQYVHLKETTCIKYREYLESDRQERTRREYHEALKAQVDLYTEGDIQADLVEDLERLREFVGPVFLRSIKDSLTRLEDGRYLADFDISTLCEFDVQKRPTRFQAMMYYFGIFRMDEEAVQRFGRRNKRIISDPHSAWLVYLLMGGIEGEAPDWAGPITQCVFHIKYERPDLAQASEFFAQTCTWSRRRMGPMNRLGIAIGRPSGRCWMSRTAGLWAAFM